MNNEIPFFTALIISHIYFASEKIVSAWIWLGVSIIVYFYF